VPQAPPETIRSRSVRPVGFPALERLARDRRCRGALLLAALSLLGVLQFRTAAQELAVVIGEGIATLVLIAASLLSQTATRVSQAGLRGSQAGLRGSQAGLRGQAAAEGPLRRWLSRLLPIAAMATPVITRFVLGLIGLTPTPWELVMLTMLGIGGVALVLSPDLKRNNSLGVICSGFLMLFTASISDHHTTAYLAAAWVTGCLGWMAANHWERLEVHLAQDVRRARGIKPTMMLIGLAAAGASALIGSTWRPATRSLSAGVMPTSGGDSMTDPGARSGVGNGDAVVAAQNHPVSFGAVESEIFLQSHQPSLFDVFDDVIGKPKANTQTNKAMALPNVSNRQNRFGASRSQQGEAGFSIRREARTQPKRARSSDTPALLRWIGPTGERLAIERWDHFDGIQWHRQTAAPSSESAPLTATAHAKPALARKELGGRVWFFRGDADKAWAGNVRADGVKLINLRTTQIPGPDRVAGVHIADIDRQDFFELDPCGSFFMPGRESIPSLTVIRLVTQIADEEALTGLRFIPSAQRTFTTPPATGAEATPVETAGTKRAAELAAAWTAGIESPWAKVEAIVRHLRDEFVFDRDAESSGEDPLQSFLADRRGGDHLFATAAAVMIRSLGYQSRLTAGFYVPTQESWFGIDSGEGESDVTAEDAHVWPEVRIDETSWIAVEPTPGFLPPARYQAPWRRAVAWAVAAIPWLAGLGSLGVAAWWSRRVWGEWACRLAWAMSFSMTERRRMKLLIRLLELRGKLAGASRPPGMTPRSWAGQFATAVDESLRGACERLFDAADQLFYGPARSTSADWLADAETVIRGLTSDAIVRSIAHTNGRPLSGAQNR
jgi:transglutaminase-like putative cysteine protease